MDPFFHLVEQRLREADADGKLQNLAGAGRRLVLEDLSAVPDELRAGYLLLKGNGFLPPELEAKKQYLQLADLLAACTDDERRPVLRDQVAAARLRYERLCAAPR
ncbi:MAG: DUF1992 domain-containing protein [Planctomycetes bacterium]|nr:DUF1992 domain-containing protein [Planctomycetota bacterium]